MWSEPYSVIKWVFVEQSGDLFPGVLGMFRGVSAIHLDEKGRMAMPTRYRDKLRQDSNNQMILTIDTDEPCLLLYPLSIWENIEKKIEALPSFNKMTRRIQRLLLGHATEIELDAQGRILLPPSLRDFAELQKNVVLVGQGKKFEIWNEETWNTLRKDWLQGSERNENIPEELQTLSL